ncbi:hypothetical protein [Georgenia thermotolerans]|uniref:hypothetical protein n=1 Tax=Georgenia thermotolerans TaxID=527326 RepID=UPI001264C90F|nr:hypothetical protein [Georgenia thermotolerans]
MLNLSDDVREALSGSRPADRVVGEVWYDGQLVVPNLDIGSWRIDTDATRSVRRQVTVTVTSDDGALAPWAVDDALGVAGSVLRLVYIVGGVADGQVPMGEFRITRPSVAESWRSQRLIRAFDDEGRSVVAEELPAQWSSSAAVEVQADDLTRTAELGRFVAPEAVKHTGSVIQEVARLLDGIVPVTVAAGVVDGRVPASVTYERDRMPAVEALLGSINATHRMTGDGRFEVIPVAGGAPVWDIAGGDDGVLVDFGRAMDVRDFPNIAVVEGKSATDLPLIGVARETGGALRASGPHGQIPEFMYSDIMDTQAKVTAAAKTRLANLIASRSVVLPVTCLPHPGLQEYDVVTLTTPAGTLTGQVQTVNISGGPGGVDPMGLGMVVAWEQMAAIARELRRR